MEWLKRLRYLDPSRALHIISLEEALELNEDGNYVIMSDMTKEIIELLSQEYELSLDSGRLCIYEYVGGNAGNQP